MSAHGGSGTEAPLRVLLLDDSEVMLDLVGEILCANGVDEVLTATDGEQGLAVFQASDPKPQVLICDLRMPGMDGIEFLRHLAGHGYGGDIILLSGTDGALLKAAERLALAHGLNYLGALEKPVAEEALAAMLARRGRAAANQGAAAVQQLTPEEVAEGIAGDRIELLYQPKVSVRERRVLGVECLARWRHPQRGLLAPAAFIGVVEASGMVDAFTLAVFRKAIDQQRAWLAEGYLIKVNINVSMDNLLRLDLPEVLDALVAEAGLAAGNIVLEATESRLMDQLQLGLDTLIRLRLKGFGLSVDDFGTGYSTMENLKQLPFTELKVDRAFVNGAAEDMAARAILDSSVRLGRTLGLNVVAEGVETQQDWDTVVASGCDEVQGYFVARPMAAAELIDWKLMWEAKGNEERKEEMEDKASILVVDDDSTMQEIALAALGGNYRISSAASGEEALAAARSQCPDVILLDVSMPPGMDGYEACRRLKADDATAGIPVIFVSGRECIEDRLKGYEAGGEDYVVKPFDAQELEAKVAHLVKAVAERDGLKQMANAASSAAMTAMTSLSEMGLLLEAMKQFSACTSDRELADAVLASLPLYGLTGAVQIRSDEGELTRNHRGAASPLEASVIAHMAGMDRIVQFRSRMSIAYRRVSLLVHDMPVDDADRCGRLRDHLAMLAESAETRAEAIAAAAESQRRGSAMERAAAHITATLEAIDRAQREGQVTSRLAVETIMQRMDMALAKVALTTAQEDFLAEILREGLDDLMRTQTGIPGLQDRLSSIVQELKGMSGRPAMA